MKTTEKFGLNLPEKTDIFNIEHFNTNTQLIENNLYAAGAMEEIIDSLGDFEITIPAEIITERCAKYGRQIKAYINARLTPDNQIDVGFHRIFIINSNFFVDGYYSGTAIIKDGSGNYYNTVWTLDNADNGVNVYSPVKLNESVAFELKLYLNFNFIS